MCCRQLKASTSASSKALSSHRRPVITLIMQPDRSCQSIYLSVCLSNTSELLTVYGTLGAVCSGGCHRQHDRQGPSAISRRRLSVNTECPGLHYDSCPSVRPSVCLSVSTVHWVPCVQVDVIVNTTGKDLVLSHGAVSQSILSVQGRITSLARPSVRPCVCLSLRYTG